MKSIYLIFFKPFLYGLMSVIIFSACNSTFYQAASAASKDVNQSNNERYGSGSYSDATSGYSELAPQYSRINKLFDSGSITSSQRDSRKSKLNSAYKKYKDGNISYSDYKNIEDEVTN
jgi:hypothetical protein